jgi:Glycosyl transferase family 2
MYPDDMMARWRVAGSHPCNTVLALAKGTWITACDDDDEFSDDHVEVLLAHAKANRLEMVYSRALVEVEPDRFVDVGSVPLRCGEVAQGAVLYSLGLRFLKFSNTCWRNEMPADFHMWSRMERAGARIGFLDRITYLNRLQTHRRVALGAPLN